MKKIWLLGLVSLAFLMSGCGGVDGEYKCNNGSITINSNGKYQANVWRKTFVGSWSEITDNSIQLEGLANTNGMFTVNGNKIKLQNNYVNLECTK